MKFFNWAIFIPFALSLHSANAEVIWAHGVSEAGGWYDVDKYLKYDGYTRHAPLSAVSSFCWGGAAANILTYWQQHYATNLPAGVPKSDLSKGATASRDLFEVFFQNWSNKGGNTDRGIDWFLTGYDRRSNYAAQFGNGLETFPIKTLFDAGITADNYMYFERFIDSTKTYSTGGFLNPTNQPSGYSTRYKLITGPVTGNESENLGIISLSRDDIMPLIRDSLQNYGCFGLDIGGHALTCWAAEFDDTTGVAKSVWLTDTDDCHTGIQKVDLEYTYKHQQNADEQIGIALKKPGEGYNLTEIKLSNYSIYQVDANGNTVLDNQGNPVVNEETTMKFRGSSESAITSFNIFTMPTLPIPEPTSVASLLLGFGLFAGARRRKE